MGCASSTEKAAAVVASPPPRRTSQRRERGETSYQSDDVMTPSASTASSAEVANTKIVTASHPIVASHKALRPPSAVGRPEEDHSAPLISALILPSDTMPTGPTGLTFAVGGSRINSPVILPATGASTTNSPPGCDGSITRHRSLGDRWDPTIPKHGDGSAALDGSRTSEPPLRNIFAVSPSKGMGSTPLSSPLMGSTTSMKKRSLGDHWDNAAGSAKPTAPSDSVTTTVTPPTSLMPVGGTTKLPGAVLAVEEDEANNLSSDDDDDDDDDHNRGAVVIMAVPSLSVFTTPSNQPRLI